LSGNFNQSPGFDGIKTGALAFCFDAFSSREPVSTSLENALYSPVAILYFAADEHQDQG